jgi:hypothetical protein
MPTIASSLRCDGSFRVPGSGSRPDEPLRHGRCADGRLFDVGAQPVHHRPGHEGERQDRDDGDSDEGQEELA